MFTQANGNDFNISTLVRTLARGGDGTRGAKPKCQKDNRCTCRATGLEHCLIKLNSVENQAITTNSLGWT